MLKKQLDIPYSEPSWHYLPSPYYKETHFRWRDKVRSFVEKEIIPNINKWDENGTFPDNIFTKAYNAGVYTPYLPLKYGGQPTIDPNTGKIDWDYFHFLIFFDELTRCGAGGFLACFQSILISIYPIINAGNNYLKNKYLKSIINGNKIISLGVTEPSGGSDVSNIKTTAIIDKFNNNYYIVNGEKYFITNAIRANYITTAVKTREPKNGESGHNCISLLLVCSIFVFLF